MAIRYKNRNWTPNKPKATPCICPRCKIKHERMIFWTGKIPARKFCLSCDQIAARDYTPEPYSLGYMDKDESMSY